MSETFAFETQLEDDFIALLKAKLNGNETFSPTIVARAGNVVKKQTYPAVFVKAENPDDDFHTGTGNSGVMKADIMIDVCTYGPDDKSGTVHKALLDEIRQALWIENLHAALMALSNYTYFAAINGPSFPDPGDRIRKKTLQLEVKFSPTKAEA